MKCLTAVAVTAACAATSAFVLPAAPVHRALVTRSLAAPSATNLCTLQQSSRYASRLHSSPASDSDIASQPPAADSAAASEASKADADAAAKKSELAQTLKVGSFFGLWYLFNIGYNIYNKQALNMLPVPYLMASVQLGVGLLYVFPLWATGIRKAPKLAKGSLKNLGLLGVLHMLAHITAVLSLGAGAVSFTHIVKAAEPVFTAAFSALILGQIFAAPVYLSLIPVIAGVAMASLKELSFSWMAFGNAMGSNTFSALRGIMGKKQMGTPVGENMNAANLYAVLTVIAFCALTPVALLVEGAKFGGVWKAALAAGHTKKILCTNILMSGLFYYLYNEVAFLALESVHPVTHAVGNTIKRVVIIVSSVLFFRTPMSRQSVAGSAIAILGTLGYSLVKQAYDKKAKAKAAAA